MFEPTWDNWFDIPPTDAGIDQSGNYIAMDWSSDDDHYIGCVVFAGPYPAV